MVNTNEREEGRARGRLRERGTGEWDPIPDGHWYTLGESECERRKGMGMKEETAAVHCTTADADAHIHVPATDVHECSASGERGEEPSFSRLLRK